MLWGPVAFTGLANGRALVHDLAAGPDGHVVVTGPAWGGDNGLRWATFKYDASTGHTLWGPVYFDTGSGGSQNPYQVQTDAANNVFVAGYRETETDGGLAVVKYAAATGASLWVSPIVTGFYPAGVALDAAGDVFVVAEYYTGTEYDAALVKLSGATGQVIWGPISFGVGPQALVANLAVDASGNVVVAGSSYDPNEGTQDWFTFKAAGSNGATLWGPVLYEGVFQTPSRMALDPSGNPILTGTANSQLMTIKYSGVTGATLWGPVFYAAPADSAGGFWIAVNAAGDAVVTGYSYKEVGGVFDTDIVTIKYSGATGSTLWGPVLFDGAAGLDDLPYAVELDAAGNPVVGGTSETSPGTYRALALKYDGATGTDLWTPVLAWPAGDINVNGFAVRAGRAFIGGGAAKGFRTTALVETLGIATMPEDLPPTACGAQLDFTFVAQNGASGYSWSVVSGTLPQGVSLESDGSLAGTPAEEGVFPFRVEVEDSASATAARDFTLVVGGGPQVPILAQAGEACAVMLSVTGTWAGYEWLPGGETTSAITVTPLETTTYGVLLSDGSGCVTRGSITLVGTALGDSGCLAPSLLTMTPQSGPSTGGTSVSITGAGFQSGAAVRIGGANAGNVQVLSESGVTAETPALPAGGIYDVVLQNPDLSHAVLTRAWTTDFLDVPPSHIFHDYVLAILRNGVSAGCGGGNYCPTNFVTRAQMAVFLLKASLGSGYVPPPPAGIFDDVGTGGFAAAWIEDLYNRGITGGCAHEPAALLPGLPRHARPDGGLPAEGRARIRIRSSRVHRRIRRRGLLAEPRLRGRLDRAALRRGCHGRLRHGSPALLPVLPLQPRPDGRLSRQDFRSSLKGIMKSLRALKSRAGWLALAAVSSFAHAAAADSYSTVHAFSGDRGAPTGGVIKGPDGRLYGTTSRGCLHGRGSVYALIPDGGNGYVEKTLACFLPTDPGHSPVAAPVAGPDGALYGILSEGGAGNFGAIFRITTTGELTFLHSFQGLDGGSPQGALIVGSDGLLYGTTRDRRRFESRDHLSDLDLRRFRHALRILGSERSQSGRGAPRDRRRRLVRHDGVGRRVGIRHPLPDHEGRRPDHPSLLQLDGLQPAGSPDPDQ